MNNEDKLQINFLKKLMEICPNNTLQKIYMEEYLSKIDESMYNSNMKVFRCKKCYSLFHYGNDYKILKLFKKSSKIKIKCLICNSVFYMILNNNEKK